MSRFYACDCGNEHRYSTDVAGHALPPLSRGAAEVAGGWHRAAPEPRSVTHITGLIINPAVGVSGSQARTVSSTVPGVTEPDVTGPSPATIGLRDAPPHAGQVVRRVLLRRNIVIDAETAQLVAVAVQAALRADARSQPSM